MWPAETALPQATRPVTADAAGNTGTNSDFYDQKLKAWKTYQWWIAKRNDMTLVNEAVSGSVFTNITGRLSPFSVERYKAVPKDADYITLMFGLNECEPDTAQGFDPTAIVGTKNRYHQRNGVGRVAISFLSI